MNEKIVSHARADMEAMGQPGGMGPPKRTVMDWVRDNHARMPSLGGQLAAMCREAIKDVRSTMNEFFFGKAEHPPEIGTPLNPTPQIVTQEQGNFRGYDPADRRAPAAAELVQPAAPVAASEPMAARRGPESYARSTKEQSHHMER
jgi:hypothetical protein